MSKDEIKQQSTDVTEDRLLQILEKLTETSQAHGLSNSQLETLLTKVGLSSADAMRLSLRPENQDHPHISAFFTEATRLKYGEYTNKPTLRRRTYFVGIEEKDDRLTAAEIEAYNRIERTCDCRNGKWKT